MLILRPLMSPLLIVLFILLGSALVYLGARRSQRLRWRDIGRRGLMVAVVGIIFAGPSIPGESVEIVSRTEAWFVLDRTGSMAAEDWDGGKTRIEGVRGDVTALAKALAGSRFSIVTWDAQTRTVLPLTSDIGAVQSYMSIFDRELSDYSQGSSPDRPTRFLAEALNESREKHPENTRLLFIFSDGESSNEDHWKDSDNDQESTWDSVAQLVDGGAVIGYGTEQGGHMKVKRFGDLAENRQDEASSGADTNSVDAQDDYIRDFSQPNDPPAVSTIDETKLRAIAERLRVDYIHSPNAQLIESTGSGLFQRAQTEGEQRSVLATYRYILWPFAVMLMMLLTWEGVELSQKIHSLRRDRAI